MVTGVFERGVMVPRAWSAASASGFVSGMRAGVGIPWALAITSNSCGVDKENLSTCVCMYVVYMHIMYVCMYVVYVHMCVLGYVLMYVCMDET